MAVRKAASLSYYLSLITTYLLPGESPEAVGLRRLNPDLIKARGLVRDAEFIG